MRLVLSLNISIDLSLVVILEPLSLFLESLLEEDVLLAILVHILQEVDTGLVFTTPLLLTSIPLFLVLLLNKSFNLTLVRGLVRCGILVMLLELLDFPTASQSLCIFVITYSLLLC